MAVAAAATLPVASTLALGGGLHHVSAGAPKTLSGASSSPAAAATSGSAGTLGRVNPRISPSVSRRTRVAVPGAGDVASAPSSCIASCGGGGMSPGEASTIASHRARTLRVAPSNTEQEMSSASGPWRYPGEVTWRGGGRMGSDGPLPPLRPREANSPDGCGDGRRRDGGTEGGRRLPGPGVGNGTCR